VILHLVCFKYNPNVDAQARDAHRAQLRTLGTLDGVADLKVGEDVVRSPRSYDTGLSVTFRDRAALDAYAKDPRHVPIAQHGASISEHVVAVDFEI
jgi:hypothetical protein